MSFYYVLAERPRNAAIDFNCNGTVDTEQGTINTPNYRDYYENDNLCTWLISSSHRVKLIFTTFSLESGWDFLYIYDGSSTSSTPLETLDGSLSGYVVESSAEHLFLKFISDDSYTEQVFLTAKTSVRNEMRENNLCCYDCAGIFIA